MSTLISSFSLSPLCASDGDKSDPQRRSLMSKALRTSDGKWNSFFVFPHFCFSGLVSGLAVYFVDCVLFAPERIALEDVYERYLEVWFP